MTSKQLFNQQKELRDELNAVIKAKWFAQALIYVRGELMEHPGLTPAGLEGARAFEAILMGFTDEEPETSGFPGLGLQHNLEPSPKTTEKPK